MLQLFTKIPGHIQIPPVFHDINSLQKGGNSYRLLIVDVYRFRMNSAKKYTCEPFISSWKPNYDIC